MDYKKTIKRLKEYKNLKTTKRLKDYKNLKTTKRLKGYINLFHYIEWTFFLAKTAIGSAFHLILKWLN